MRAVWPMLAILALAGCAAPGPPLYSPLSEAGTFGYAEERLANDRFQVTYAAPRQTTFVVSRFDRASNGEQRLALAYDLALLRGADVAAQQGWTHFAVAARDNDTRVDVIGDRGFYRPYSGRHRHRHDRFYYNRFSYRDYAVIYATVGLTVERRDGSGTDVFDTQATLQRLLAKYPGAVPPTASG